MTPVKAADWTTVQKITIANGPARAQLISYGAT